MQSGRKIAVAGATGRVGLHLVDVLAARGHEVVPISRSKGVDVIAGDGLADALAGAEIVVDAATGPSPEQEAATAFFTTAARNLQAAGEHAGVRRIVVVSIIGCDRFTAGYGAAKLAHEQAMLSGPIPARVLRAAQFHEFVGQLVDWGRQGEVSYVPSMRTQLVAASTVAEALADLATDESCPCAGRRSRRSPARGRRTWSTWRSYSRHGGVTPFGSRARTIRLTRTRTCTRPVACCRASTPRLPARRLRNGSSRRRFRSSPEMDS